MRCSPKEHGWSPDKFEQWLGDGLTLLLRS